MVDKHVLDHAGCGFWNRLSAEQDLKEDDSNRLEWQRSSLCWNAAGILVVPVRCCFIWIFCHNLNLLFFVSHFFCFGICPERPQGCKTPCIYQEICEPQHSRNQQNPETIIESFIVQRFHPLSFSRCPQRNRTANWPWVVEVPLTYNKIIGYSVFKPAQINSEHHVLLLKYPVIMLLKRTSVPSDLFFINCAVIIQVAKVQTFISILVKSNKNHDNRIEPHFQGNPDINEHWSFIAAEERGRGWRDSHSYWFPDCRQRQPGNAWESESAKTCLSALYSFPIGEPVNSSWFSMAIPWGLWFYW